MQLELECQDSRVGQVATHIARSNQPETALPAHNQAKPLVKLLGRTLWHFEEHRLDNASLQVCESAFSQPQWCSCISLA
jgi:hypothetical protein